MKGPVFFTMSLVAVAVLAVAFLLPARREREELAERIRRGWRTDKATADAARRLSRAIGMPRSGAPAAVRASALRKEFAPGLPAGDAASMSFPLPWERVTELLEWLAVEQGLVPSHLTVTETDDPAECRVEVRFEPHPPGVTPR